MDRSSEPRVACKAVFLDRDGVINVKLTESRYVTKISEFRFLPGVLEALSILKQLGFLLVVTTNQRGVARGFMSEEDLEKIHRYMETELRKHGVSLDGIYYCPHEEFENCPCRKPEPGMLLAASQDLGIDLSASYMVGDSPSDIAAGRSAGVVAVRINDEQDENADMVFPNLLDFALFMQGKTPS